MGSGIHSRCPLTGSCGDHENHHYYYKPEGLHLRKNPKGWADKVARSMVPPSLLRVGMPTDRAMEVGVGCEDALVREVGRGWAA